MTCTLQFIDTKGRPIFAENRFGEVMWLDGELRKKPHDCPDPIQKVETVDHAKEKANSIVDQYPLITAIIECDNLEDKIIIKNEDALQEFFKTQKEERDNIRKKSKIKWVGFFAFLIIVGLVVIINRLG